jgi:hypothetical protein
MSENPYNLALIKYLEKSSPEEWHQIAWNWNWDNGIEPLLWIIRQPQCNKGTALLIYWYSGPKWLYQYNNRDEVKPYNLISYDLVKEIEEKYTSGFYQNDNINFDPANDFDGHDWTKEYEEIEVKQNIPDMMFKPTLGQKVSKKVIAEGYPQEVIEEVEGQQK